MGAADLPDAPQAQDDAMCMGMTCAERARTAVGEARSPCAGQKVRNLTKRSGLRYPEADVRSTGSADGRGLDRLLITELATCGFAERGENVVLQGLTGTGKTYLACALAKAACAKRIRSCCVRQPDLEDLWLESRERVGGERKLVRKYGAYGLLVVDEWLLERPDELFRGMLLELMELRYGTASTVFRARFRKKDWHARLGGGVHADAITGRIVHNAVWVEMGETDTRQRLGGADRLEQPVLGHDAGGIDSRCCRDHHAISTGTLGRKYSHKAPHAALVVDLHQQRHRVFGSRNQKVYAGGGGLPRQQIGASVDNRQAEIRVRERMGFETISRRNAVGRAITPKCAGWLTKILRKATSTENASSIPQSLFAIALRFVSI